MSLDSDITATMSTAGSVLQAWKRAYDGKEAESFIKQVSAQTIIWRTLSKMLLGMYRERHTAEFDFTDPAFQAKLLYSEGYKKALQDVYRLIPQTTEN
jgi:hypothetical protein